eukprot:scaffold80139_cov33-Tisochrysis_lutea.AAC.1
MPRLAHCRHALLAAALGCLLCPGLCASADGPPERRPLPHLRRLHVLERQFEAEAPQLKCQLESEEEESEARPLLMRLLRLREALLHALAAPDENGLCRLHHAVLEQDAERVRSLIKAGAELNVAAGDAGVLPLHLSILAGDDDPTCLQELLDGGADTNAPDANGVTALHAACSLNMPRLTSILLSAGAVRAFGARAGLHDLFSLFFVRPFENS